LATLSVDPSSLDKNPFYSFENEICTVGEACALLKHNKAGNEKVREKNSKILKN
jgi:hypothetical protein